MAGLISVADAEALIASSMPSYGAHKVKLQDAVGRILRQDVTAERDQPPFDRVMMDGVAIRWSERLPTQFDLSGSQMAGMGRQGLQGPDQCLEVTTGAVLPEGCDCIIPVEEIVRKGHQMTLVDGADPKKDQFIHRQGSDCRAGAKVLESGAWIGPPEAALLAANGLLEVLVSAAPKIAVLTTGDEIVGVGASLREGQVRSSNDRAIDAVLRTYGFNEITARHVPDDLDATTETLRALLSEHDVVIVSGGVSVGQRDFVAEALSALDVRRVFHRIAQKPGKPMWFGLGPARQAVFALPGNPLSSLVCAVRYVRPALLAAMGLRSADREIACLSADVKTSEALTVFVPARVRQDRSGRLMAVPVPSATSGDFASLARADGFVELPSGKSEASAGDTAPFFRW